MAKPSITTHELNSPSLQGNLLNDPATRPVLVYLPPGYDIGSTRYPVVYFLHAYSGSAMGWLNPSPFSRNVPERLHGLIEDGQIPGCIGVFIDGWTSLGGTQWINSEAVGRYRDYVARDIVAWVDKSFRSLASPAGRILVGRSSGGYGALAMARFHAETFGHIGAHSPDSGFEYCYLPDWPKALGAIGKAGGVEAWYRDFRVRAAATKMRSEDHTVISMLAMAASYSPKKGEPLNADIPVDLQTGRIKIDVWNRWLVNDPVRFVGKDKDAFRKLRSLFLDCGTRDEFHLRWGTRMISEELKAAGIAHQHEEFEDGHQGASYRFEASLRYLVPRTG